MKSSRPIQAVIFDFNRTLFDPTVYALYPGVKPMLEELAETKQLFLYSRKAWDRSNLLATLGIDRCFKAVYFVSQKTKENLGEILTEHKLTAAETMIVGDMLEDEVCVGSELGLRTVWFRQEIFAADPNREPVCIPDHTVSSIEELRDLLAQI